MSIEESAPQLSRLLNFILAFTNPIQGVSGLADSECAFLDRALIVFVSAPGIRQSRLLHSALLLALSQVLHMFNPALPFTGLHVLVVDSDPDSRYLLTTLFAVYGCETFAVASAEAALATLRQSKPDLLITEINLPNADGYSLISKVKALEAEQRIEIPAIALTVFARSGDRDRALAAGFRKYLSKPVDIDQLMATAASLTRPIQAIAV